MIRNNTYRRKRVKTGSLRWFPWVGTSNAQYDLFSTRSLSLLPNVGTGFGDGFYWQDPKEVPDNQIQPFYGSYQDGGNLTFESYIPKLKTRNTIKSLTVSPTAYYHGGTSFYDPAQTRVISAFEDNTPLGSWPGIQGPSDSALGTLVGVPVGAQCFAPNESATGSITTGDTITPPVTEPNGTVFYQSGEWPSGTPDYVCSMDFGFRDYFEQTREYITDYSEQTVPFLTGENLTIFVRRELDGQFRVTTDRQVSSVVVGFQEVLDPNANAGQPVMSGAQQVKNVEVSNQFFGLWPTTTTDVNLSAYDDSLPGFSDQYSISTVPSRNYGWTIISAFPTAVDDLVTFEVTSGGDTGLEYQTNRTVQFTHDATLRVETEEVSAGLADSESSTFAALDANRMGYRMTTEGPDPIPGGLCTMPSSSPDWTDTFSKLSGEFYRFNFTSNTPTNDTTYFYQANPLLTEASFTAGQWVLVSSQGLRFFMTLVSSTFPYATAPAPTTTELTASILDVTGSQFTFEIDSITPIEWDYVVGNIADMTPGTFEIYVANSLSHWNPRFAQLLPNDFNFEFTASEGGGT